MSFAQQARDLCGDRHVDGPESCPICRALEIRLQPVTEALRDVLADADLRITVYGPGVGGDGGD